MCHFLNMSSQIWKHISLTKFFSGIVIIKTMTRKYTWANLFDVMQNNCLLNLNLSIIMHAIFFIVKFALKEYNSKSFCRWSQESPLSFNWPWMFFLDLKFKKIKFKQHKLVSLIFQNQYFGLLFSKGHQIEIHLWWSYKWCRNDRWLRLRLARKRC